MQTIILLSSRINCSKLIYYHFKRSDRINIFRFNKFSVSRNVFYQQSYPVILSKHSSLFNNLLLTSVKNFSINHFSLRKEAKNEVNLDESAKEQEEKLSLYKRYKKMLKEYWYVLIPVHIVTSSVWFALFYYIAKSGFDIVPVLETLNLPETVIKPFRNSSLGYIAAASALYKLATPARYMVTLGGTTVAIKQLTKRGLIKPVPSKDKFKTMIKNKLQSKSDSVKKSDS